MPRSSWLSVSPGSEKLALDPDGVLYVLTGTRVRRIDPRGAIKTVFGASGPCTLTEGKPADGIGACRLMDIGVDHRGLLYFIVFNNHRIYRLTGSNFLTFVAGGGINRGDGGLARNAGLWWPQGITFAANGDLVFADNNNQRIRRIDGFGPFNLSREQVTFANSLG